MADLTDADLARLAALAEAATPGPWTFKRDGDYWEIPEPNIGGKDNMEGNDADYELCAVARDAVPKLVAEVRRLREALNRIACWTDDFANRRLKARDDYSGFDEPASVKEARAALRQHSGEG